MARNVYGLDLGTYDIKILIRKKDRIWHAKNVIAMKDKKYIFLSETMLMRCMKRLREIYRSYFR